MISLAPSILSADFSKLGEQVNETIKEGIRILHIDVMDGLFVPSISFGFPIIETLRPVTGQIFDVHLMINEPIRYIERFAKAGADHITVHQEACSDIPATLEAIKNCGCTCGIAVNPETPAELVYPYLEQVQMVLVMTVHPGFGGQKYIDETTPKIQKLRQYCNSLGLEMVIETDGGIKADNLHVVMEAGSDQIVCGSSVFGGDIRGNIQRLNEQISLFESGK